MRFSPIVTRLLMLKLVLTRPEKFSKSVYFRMPVLFLYPNERRAEYLSVALDIDRS